MIADDAFDRAEAPPEFVREQAAANRGLQVEAAHRNFACNRAAVFQQFGVGGGGQGGQAEQPDVVAGFPRDLRLGTGLRRLAADTRDLHDPLCGSALELGAVCAASRSTGWNSPTCGSRMANCVVWTPTAIPPAPASQ